MILDRVHELNRLRIVLASGSPRRRELLERIGLQFTVRVSKFEENLDKSSFPDAIAYNLATAHGKMSDILETLAHEESSQQADIVITCDTIVVPCDDPLKIVEKAACKAEAAQMIRDLRGKSHYVFSTLLVHFTKLHQTFEEVVRTEVKMASISDAAVAAYVENEEAWRGKSGAYGIQDLASTFIEGIQGDFYNVVGFPLCTFCKRIRDTIDKHPEVIVV